MRAEWVEITVEVPESCSEAVANLLLETGAPGVQVVERGDRTGLVAHFADVAPVDAIRTLCTDLTPHCQPDIALRLVRNEDWAEAWKSHFQPQLIGERLYVRPPWVITVPAGRVPITIEPGMAFGTGQHASTRGCLELLERLTVVRRITRALDVGTGSGILAIALAKLGVVDVVAIDTDPAACTIAQENVSRNDVCRQVRIGSGLQDAGGSFSMIVANLYTNVLEALAPALVSRLQPTAALVCSGLLAADEARVLRTYEAHHCALETRWEAEGWVTLGLRKRHPE